MTISKQLFVDCIENLMQQQYEDIANAELVKQMFQVTEFCLYDNSKLVSSIISLLQEYFTKDESGHCEILHYCYFLDFGKCGEEYESPEQLYDRLSPKPDGRRYKIGKDNSFH